MSEAAVLEALRCACSQEPTVLKLGERQLRAWETEKGYYASLTNVFTNGSLDPGLRWMALTCVKNGVDKHWRPTAPEPVSAEEKDAVRAGLLTCLEEPQHQVLAQMAELIARIARLDCPAHWPQLLPTLTESVRSSSALLQKCSLVVLQQVIKTLAARRLVIYRKVFYDVTTGLFVYVGQLWAGHLRRGVELASTGSAAAEALEMSQICLKILRLMMVYGFTRFHSVLEALQFMNNLLEQIPVLLRLRAQLPEGHSAVDGLEQAIILMAKILRDVQNHHPVGYASLISPSLQLIHSTIFVPGNEGLLFERYVLILLNLFRQIVQCEDYTLARNMRLSESSPPPLVVEAHQARLAFFTAHTSQQLLERLVGHFMVLSPEELECWEKEPEEFAQERAGEMYQYSLRPSVEAAFLALFHAFQQTLADHMVGMIQAVQSTDASADLDTLRLKEAVYKAAGLGAYDLYEEVDYDGWYSSQLLRELEIQDPRYKIVRNRVVWLLGNWVSVKMGDALRPSLYSTLSTLLLPTEDMVVRLSAAEALRCAIDDIGFEVAAFAPYIADSMSNLFQLLQHAKECETKMRVLNVASLLVERTGPAIQPHISALLQYMPQLWAESEAEDSGMLRCIILSTLNNIVKGLGALSPALHGFLLPVIQLATDVKMPEHVYLAEDGLQLWLTTLHHASTPSPPLLHLLLNMADLLGLNPPSDEESASSLAGLMDIDSMSLLVCFSIMDAYVVLSAADPAPFVQLCGEVVVRGCCSSMGDVKPEAVVRIVHVGERIARLYPAHFPQLLQPMLPAVLRKLMDREEHPPVITACLSLLARVLLQNSTVFFSFMEHMAVEAGQSTADFFGALVDQWSDKLDSMIDIQDRKLTGLSVASLLPLADTCVTSRFGVLLNMCVEVLYDVTDTSDEGLIYDTLVTPRAIPGDDQSIETEHDKREKQLAQFDPVRTVPLHRHVTGKLHECVAVHGLEAYASLVEAVDMTVREQVAEFVPAELVRTLLAIEGTQPSS